MKIMVVSDIHANLAALEAVTGETFDRLICLGDMVGYGPAPIEVISFIREDASIAIRGNHDNALAYDVDCQCSPHNKPLADATLAYHRTLLGHEDLDWLRTLPSSAEFKLDGYRFAAFHGTPGDQLYGYEITPDLPDDRLREEIEGVRADFILLGHTHLPMVRGIGSRVVVNPGSVGQPRDGIPEAGYAVIENGIVELKRCKYDLRRTVDALMNLPLSRDILDGLIALLEQGGRPEAVGGALESK
ncbi:MAG: metallophosphoesterase family protein [Candidatus Methylomirabilis oxyfera]|nr:metallophosphoesterase family protein [Candidatus Methylomirabilis oxyfera]